MTEHMDINGLAGVLEAVTSILNRQERAITPEITARGTISIRRLADAFEQLEVAMADYRQTLNECVQ